MLNLDEPCPRHELTAAQREDILQIVSTRKSRSGRTLRKGVSSENLGAFVGLLEFDLGWLLFSEEWNRFHETKRTQSRRARGRPRYDARRRFAISFAANLWEVLGIQPGRGRSGPYYDGLAAAFRAVGIEAEDLKTIADYGARAVLPTRSDLTRALPTSFVEQDALRRHFLSKRARASNNRQKRRNHMKVHNPLNKMEI